MLTIPQVYQKCFGWAKCLFFTDKTVKHKITHSNEQSRMWLSARRAVTVTEHSSLHPCTHSFRLPLSSACSLYRTETEPCPQMLLGVTCTRCHKEEASDDLVSPHTISRKPFSFPDRPQVQTAVISFYLLKMSVQVWVYKGDFKLGIQEGLVPQNEQWTSYVYHKYILCVCVCVYSPCV